jgi:hypothetical protein
MKIKTILLCCALAGCTTSPKEEKTVSAPPRIVNIIHFVRQTEPRSREITDEVLYQTVVEQVKQLKQYRLPGTFLLQYDALINPKYQELLKNEPAPGSEVGAWWEITQPHVEAAGMTWRGRSPWDWHADVGFATGYTPGEREMLVDVYMEKFKAVFGRYPASVGSWFIDAHTLGYLYDKYGIVASCNCKDQIGTDGYTLWGGYWNQAYYPSRKNAYMPAQTERGQIPVPVFRMLGSDPIYQYDQGLGNSAQGVITLEPASGEGGRNRAWVEWFFRNMFEEPCLTFNYVQAGQENSFTWEQMEQGLNMQIPLLDSLYREGSIRIETLEASGRWFRENYPVTPPSAVTALSDYTDQGKKTIWYNSRFYRANLIWEGESFRFRDIHLFDERMESDYLTKAGTSTQCIYMTLPVVDGFVWSKPDELAGLRMTDNGGHPLPVGAPVVSEPGGDVLQVEFSTLSGQTFRIVFHEDCFEVSCIKGGSDDAWALELTVAEGAELPFRSIDGNRITASFRGFEYRLECREGAVAQTEGGFKLTPANGKVILDCSKRI